MAILRKAVTATGIVAGLGLAFALGRSSNSEESKERRWRRFFGYTANPDEVIDSFVEYIRTESRNNLKSLQNRRRADPEAALAEAMVFGMLQQLRLRPTIGDEPGIGGADFLCTYGPIVFTDVGARELIVEQPRWSRLLSKEIADGETRYPMKLRVDLSA
jgi:threonine dehydrogenase-like Zn-dependent dehydrogenase